MVASGPGRDGVRKLGVVLAVFDFPTLVVGLRAVIAGEPDMEVLEEIVDRDALGDQVARVAPDVIVTECLPFGTPGCASFRAIEAVRAAQPSARILALECRCGVDTLPLAFRAGANGFLTRQAHPSDVLDAIRRVGRGETYVSPTIVTRMVNTYVLRAPEIAPDDPYECLSERAREVLRLAAYGHTNREIARALRVSEQTVHNHRATIMERFGFHDRIELLRYALRRGVIQVADL
jgi:two-component system response regulator NreC